MSTKTAATPLNAAATQADRHRSPWTTRQKIKRVVWSIVQTTAFGMSPSNSYRWRAMLLRLFGAKIADHVQIRPSVRCIIPWHLEIGEHTSIGDHAILYSLGKITLGKYVTVSQYAHLCAGSHDPTSRAMTLVTAPITLGDDSWIAADAFVGPGVTVGDRAIVGARASAFTDVPADVVVGGNPAKFIKPREFQRG